MCNEEEKLATRVRIVSKLVTTLFAGGFISRGSGCFADENLISVPIYCKVTSDLYSRICICTYFLLVYPQ
jgi:hypothetical protein